MVETPLDGFVILELAENLPGPFLGQMLVDLGARVIKIEKPGGDFARHASFGIFDSVNRGKEVVEIDLKDNGTRGQFLGYVESSDGLIDGFRPNVLKRLGFHRELLLEHNPGLVMVTIPGYDPDGPNSLLSGHDINYAAASGVLSLAGGSHDCSSWNPGIPVADLSASLFGLSGLLCGLLAKSVSGVGSELSVPITECMSYLLNPRLGALRYDHAGDVGELKSRLVSRPGYGVFECVDGIEISIAALEDRFWDGLINVLGSNHFETIAHRSMQNRFSSSDTLNHVIDGLVRQWRSGELIAKLRENDVPCAVVTDPATAFRKSAADDYSAETADSDYFKLPIRFRGSA